MTDRSIGAAIDSSPFENHEPQAAPEQPTLANFPEFQLECLKAIANSFTREEIQLIFKVGFALVKALGTLKPEQITGAKEAFTKTWEALRNYRETGEV